MKLADKHIDRIIKLHQDKFGQPFTSREEAAQYLLTLCKIFTWLLKHKDHGKPQDQTDDNSLA